MRCSKTAGFHGRSTLITVFAACKFNPVEPAFVVRNRRQSGLFLNSWTNPCLSFCGTEPSRRTKRRWRFLRRGSISVRTVVHFDKISAVRFSSENKLADQVSRAFSFGDYARACLATRNVLFA